MYAASSPFNCSGRKKPSLLFQHYSRIPGSTYYSQNYAGIICISLVTMRVCNVSTGRVLQLIAMAIGCVGRTRAQPKMWEFEVLMRVIIAG